MRWRGSFIIERSEMMIRRIYSGYNRKEDSEMINFIKMLIIAREDYKEAVKELHDENDDEE